MGHMRAIKHILLFTSQQLAAGENNVGNNVRNSRFNKSLKILYGPKPI